MADDGLFIKVSEGMPEHPKIVSAGGDAAWLNICAIAYAARNQTDGLIAAGMVPRLSDRKHPAKLAGVLVEFRLWHEPGHDCKRCPQPLPGFYVIHDYLEHQQSAEEIRAARDAKGAGGGFGNHRRWHVGRGRADPECSYCIAMPSDNRSDMRSDTDQSAESIATIPRDIAGTSVTDRSAIAEVELEEDKTTPPTPPRGAKGKRRQAYDYGDDQDFLRFWETYPVKHGKPEAYQAWLKALGRGADPGHIINAAQAYKTSPSRNPDKTKYPQGWLNGERYLDENSGSESGPGRGRFFDF